MHVCEDPSLNSATFYLRRQRQTKDTGEHREYGNDLLLVVLPNFSVQGEHGEA